MLEIKYQWSHNGDSGGLTPVKLDFPPVESVLYVQHSTLATTNTVEFQTGLSSAGPWATEASTTISTAAAGAIRLRVTGPYTWMRPYSPTKSTGTYTFELLGVS